MKHAAIISLSLLALASASGAETNPLTAKLAALGENSWVKLGLGWRGGHEVPAVFDEANGLFFKYGGCGDKSPRIKISFPKGDHRYPNGYSNTCWVINMAKGKWEQRRQYDCSWPKDQPANGCSRLYTYDSKRKLIWMLGAASDGGGGGDTRSLWAYDGKADKFSQMSARPPRRLDGNNMVYDSANDLIVLVTGDPTWTYDPRTKKWRSRKTPGAPVAGKYTPMVFDPVSKKVILPQARSTGKFVRAKKRPAATATTFWASAKRYEKGKKIRGFEEQVFTTWTFDAAAGKWQKLALKPEEQPCPRWRFGLTYDSLNRKVILVAGSTNTWDHGEQYYNDVWTFDTRTDKWKVMKPAGAKPPVRERESRHCAYSARHNAVIFLTSRTGLWAYRYKSKKK